MDITWRRVKHHLASSSKKMDDHDMKMFAPIEQRNTKLVNSIAAFRKDIGSLIKTGLKEENLDKRRKKVDEIGLVNTLNDYSVHLHYLQSTCLYKLYSKMAKTLYNNVEKQVNYELMIEKRVYDQLQFYQDQEKAYQKTREKLNKAVIDYEIAQKTFEKENTQSNQEQLDSMYMKMENLKDQLITDAFTFASHEQDIAKIVLRTVEEKHSYYQQMADSYANLIPELRDDINNARPCPVYGVDLGLHVTSTGSRIATVIEECCTFLREIGFNEKGLFRVNGNNSKIRRIKAAFDSGQFDVDKKNYVYDPFSITSALKSYLRELPDPLLTNALHKQWTEAIKKEGEERLIAFEKCINLLPMCNRDNLSYLMKFLTDMLEHEDKTSMNASNLAIVFAPNLMNMELDGSNTAATKIVETLIVNSQRFFGFPSTNEVNIDQPRKGSDLSLTSSFTRNIKSTISPRSVRPKDRAPPPPPIVSPEADLDLIDFGRNERAQSVSDIDEWSDEFLSEPSSQSNSLSRSFTEKRPHRPPPPSYRNPYDVPPQNRPVSYHIAVGANSGKGTDKKDVEEHCNKETVTSLKSSPFPVAPERKRLSIISTASTTSSRPLEDTEISKSTVIDAGNNRTLVSLNGDSIATKPKPPLPVKPKELNEKESSRL